ncbi:tetratricopeptide repeat protein [Neptunomonas qingdaonensis]|uniref:Uncharacterized protein n=1 Tax=Neptunomonas qingdaonensis TaxID=1045558 RepID=A0A1I2N045_9GAMM|nr:tetratricopeptide repeat protein [Neptunomonas qingdaonensis]SFF95077.1 hypothetical protein SAMN05216175_10299 [Neptunomonas qingdaonensis]
MFTTLNHKCLSSISIFFLIFSVFFPTKPAESATIIKSAPWVGYTLSGAPCKGKDTTFGPFDYRYRDRVPEAISMVEGAHFNAKVENLKEGAKHKYNLYGDIDYTLRAFPNHARALYTVIRFRTLDGPYNKKQLLLQPECYLNRAIGFTPNDPTIYSLYGIYLHKLDKYDEALEKYLHAEELAPNDIQTKYNIGLLLCDMKKYNEAKKYAIDVYNKNYPFKGLKNRLISAGFW